MDKKGSNKRPTSTVDNLKLSREQRDHIKDVIKENEEEYKKALNGVASSPNGLFFLRALVSSLGVFDPINIKGNVDEVVQRNVYLRKIRPFLEDEFRKDIEI